MKVPVVVAAAPTALLRMDEATVMVAPLLPMGAPLPSNTLLHAVTVEPDCAKSAEP